MIDNNLMSREKQIEEMAKVICENIDRIDGLAEALYNAGYRKASEVAREIFEEIDNILYKFSYPSLTAIGKINVMQAEGYHLRTRDYAELKKKFTEREK